MDHSIAIPALVAFFITLILGPGLISFLHKLKFGQFIREEGPESHLKKSGTPTMGGILFLVGILVGSAFYIPDYKKIEELHGKDLSEEDIQKIIWDKVKENNKKLTSYKAVKKIEIKKDEFEKTTTMKIKRYAEMNKK